MQTKKTHEKFPSMQRVKMVSHSQFLQVYGAKPAMNKRNMIYIQKNVKAA